MEERNPCLQGMGKFACVGDSEIKAKTVGISVDLCWVQPCCLGLTEMPDELHRLVLQVSGDNALCFNIPFTKKYHDLLKPDTVFKIAGRLAA